MEKKETFRFGVMGAGNISNKFCDAAEKTEEVCVTAVAARSEERAREFAEKYEIHTYYGNYEEMLQKEKLEGVYIGVVTGMHVQLTELCIRYGIPVLCEKALTGSSEEAERIFRLAEEKKIFVMEGVWSLFLPANRKAREWLREGRIGKLAVSNVEIGFTAPKNKENRYFNKEAGGGAALDLLIYALALTMYFCGEDWKEEQIQVIYNEDQVDVTEHVILRYEEHLSFMTATYLANVDERLELTGSEGKIMIRHPHYADQIVLYDGQGKLIEQYSDQVTENGFVYEIKEMVDCVRNGKTESSIVPHRMTLECAKIFDRIVRVSSTEQSVGIKVGGFCPRHHI